MVSTLPLPLDVATISIPRFVWRLYKDCPLGIRLFAWGRTLVCSFDRLLDAVPREGLIVDLGCGTGLFANLLARQSPERPVRGYDLDATVIAAARTAAGDQANVTFAVADATTTTHHPAPHIVTAIDLFHHLPANRHRPMIEAAYAMLEPGGYFLLKDIDPAPTWKRWANWCHDALVARGNPHITLRSRQDYEALLRQAGFTVEIIAMPKTYLAHVLYLCRKS